MPSNEIRIQDLREACSKCNLRELCLPIGLNLVDIEELDKIVQRRRKVKRGEYLYRASSPFASLYAVRSGSFKSVISYEDGREQVTGFSLPGEILGMDAINTSSHCVDVIGLEDSIVCEIPFNEFERLTRSIPSLQRQFYKVMSREIVRDQEVMMMLGSMKAEERLASFLLNISQRLLTRGFSSKRFNLHMTREEIGSFLGLKLETVSRAFSKFKDEGFIEVQNKYIELKDLAALRNLVGHTNINESRIL